MFWVFGANGRIQAKGRGVEMGDLPPYSLLAKNQTFRFKWSTIFHPLSSSWKTFPFQTSGRESQRRRAVESRDHSFGWDYVRKQFRSGIPHSIGFSEIYLWSGLKNGNRVLIYRIIVLNTNFLFISQIGFQWLFVKLCDINNRIDVWSDRFLITEDISLREMLFSSVVRVFRVFCLFKV